METSRLCVGLPRNLTQRQTDPFPDVSAPTRLVPTCLRIWANNCRFLREGDRSLAIWKEARQVVEKERGCVCAPLLASVALRLCLLLGNWDQLAWSARVAHFQSPPSKSLRTTTICCKNMPNPTAQSCHSIEPQSLHRARSQEKATLAQFPTLLG